jgi:excisionase family DNA binding protein
LGYTCRPRCGHPLIIVMARLIVSDLREWLTRNEAEQYTRTSAATILRAARSGRLRAFKLNGARVWRFRLQDLNAWLEGGGQANGHGVPRQER